jgi:hypothetical protein
MSAAGFTLGVALLLVMAAWHSPRLLHHAAWVPTVHDLSFGRNQGGSSNVAMKDASSACSQVQQMPMHLVEEKQHKQCSLGDHRCVG